jgi:predicted nucleotidyltransferase
MFMTEERIKEIVEQFTLEAKKIYGITLRNVILYGSCARGDFEQDSDIDIMVLLDVSQEDINEERKKILDVSDRLDLTYDVVLAPVFQSYQIFEQYVAVSKFYQNIQREGVQFA